MKKELQNAREDYQQHSLSKAHAHTDAIEQFKQWLREYQEISKSDFNAMTLCTVNTSGQPSARVVLLKGVDREQFEFYTNYDSRKGLDIRDNPAVALCFFWPELERQIRIEGWAEEMSEEESAEYFKSRPYGSRIGALASPQSQPISREQLSTNMKELEAKYPDEVPKPKHWGGYRVRPEVIEFWQGRSNRLHDRLEYRRSSEGGWTIERLAP